MKFDPQKYHRPFDTATGRHSIRLQGYDYTQPGAYFVTLVTFQRNILFGEIIDGEVILSRKGEIVREEWFASVDIRKEIRLHPEEFVVMPNHVHGIVWIEYDDAHGVGADGLVGVNSPMGEDGIHVRADGRPPLRQPPTTRMKPRSLGSFISGFKSSVTKRIHDELNESGIWQRNYYERVIRNEKNLMPFAVISNVIH
ncbi:hypothetical protein ANAEL_00803 [Anaerolineales bacterium]|nr:hypothetical protein ANAEL_00803 [Anaerolineales bacterium]